MNLARFQNSVSARLAVGVQHRDDRLFHIDPSVNWFFRTGCGHHSNRICQRSIA